MQSLSGYPRLSWPQAVEQALQLVDRLSDVELAGQVLAIGFSPPKLTADVATTLRRLRPGAIILFSRNIPDPAGVTALNRDLQQLAAEAGLQPGGLPFLIGTDQEGGTVVRLGPPATVFPGNMALGALGKAAAVQQAAAVTARQLRAVGITWNYAPVLDVNNNPANPVIGIRSYGEDPELVAALGRAAIRGYQAMGVMATGKHFPGHGDTAVDSHLGLASVPHGGERLEQVELRPFREAIRAGLDCIMTAHVHFPAVEPEEGIPATLSGRVLTGLLRQKLGFPGLVVTDSLEMKAIADNIGLDQAGWRAVAAGADVVMVSHQREDQEAVFAGILAAVGRGQLLRERLRAAAARAIAARLRYGLTDARAEAQRLTAVLAQAGEQGWEAVGVGRAADRQLALELAVGGATWVRPLPSALPPPSPQRPWLVVEFGVRATSFAEDPLAGEGPLARAVRAALPAGTPPGALVGMTVLDPAAAANALAAGTAGTAEATGATGATGAERSASAAGLAEGIARLQRGDYGVLCVATHDAHRLGGQAQVVERLYQACRQASPPVPGVAVGMRTPYEAAVLPSAWPYLCIYGPCEPTLAGAAQVLLGRQEASGELPVSLPQLPGEGTAGRARSWRERTEGAEWVVGIDAGGTRTRCWVAGIDGRLLGRGEAGPANLQVVGAQAAAAAVDQALQQAMEQAARAETTKPLESVGQTGGFGSAEAERDEDGRSTRELAARLATTPRLICLGLAGADRPGDQLALAQALLARGWDVPILWENDASIALAAGRSLAAQVVLVAGTGSIALGRDSQGRLVRAGGWGYLLGDEGSGYDLGRRALIAVLCAWDGRGPATSLTEAILREAGVDQPPALIPLVYRGDWDRPRIAQLSRIVLAQAAAGDPVAVGIVRQGARELLLLVEAVARRLQGRPLPQSGQRPERGQQRQPAQPGEMSSAQPDETPLTQPREAPLAQPGETPAAVRTVQPPMGGIEPVRAVAAGGLLAVGSPLWDWMRQVEKERTQDGQTRPIILEPLPAEPAVGAVLLALERVGALAGKGGDRVVARVYGSYRERKEGVAGAQHW